MVSEMNSNVSKNIIGTFDGKCADSIENNNGMLLNDELWKKLFDSEEYKRNLNNGFYIGFLGHPEDPGCQDFEKACIIMREGHIDSDGQVYGQFDLIDTPVGRIVKSFIDADVKFGISVRGAGDVGPDGYVDPDTFIFRGFDLVAFPAYDDAIPRFTQIAASSAVRDSKVYKEVTKSISDNISKITSSESLEILKSQFSPKSDQYKIIEAQQSIVEDPIDISKEKLEGMINLYFDEVKCNKSISKENDDLKSRVESLERTNNRLGRQISAMRRIMSNQLSVYSKELKSAEARTNLSVRANLELKKKLEDLTSKNLNYLQKITSSSKEKSEKDDIIASLKLELRKTVTQLSKQTNKTSDLESKLDKLLKEVQSSNKLIEEYQDAYASIYANALGVGLDSISVTASTSVEELKDIINNGTSTVNIPANLDTFDDVDILNDDTDTDIDNTDMVVL